MPRDDENEEEYEEENDNPENQNIGNEIHLDQEVVDNLQQADQFFKGFADNNNEGVQDELNDLMNQVQNDGQNNEENNNENEEVDNVEANENHQGDDDEYFEEEIPQDVEIQDEDGNVVPQDNQAHEQQEEQEVQQNQNANENGEEQPEVNEEPEENAEEEDPLFNSHNIFFNDHGRLTLEQAKEAYRRGDPVGVEVDKNWAVHKDVNNQDRVMRKIHLDQVKQGNLGRISDVERNAEHGAFANSDSFKACIDDLKKYKDDPSLENLHKYKNSYKNFVRENGNGANLEGNEKTAYKSLSRINDDFTTIEYFDKFAEGYRMAKEAQRQEEAEANQDQEPDNEAEVEEEQEEQELEDNNQEHENNPPKDDEDLDEFEEDKQKGHPRKDENEDLSDFEEDEKDEEIDEEAEREKNELTTKGRILNEAEEMNRKRRTMSFLGRVAATILPTQRTQYGRIRSRADTLNKMAMFTEDETSLGSSKVSEGEIAGGNRKKAYAYQKTAAFNRYNQLDKEYKKIGFFARVGSYFVPNSWTHAGRCRTYMKMCQGIIQGDSGLNPYSMKEIGGTKNKDGSKKTAGEMMMDGYKSRYNNLNKEYNEISRAKRFFSYLLPNSLTKAGKLREKMYQNDEKIKQYGFTDDDITNLKSMEDEKTENRLRHEAKEEDVNRIVQQAGNEVSQETEEEVRQRNEELARQHKLPDNDMVERIPGNFNPYDVEHIHDLDQMIHNNRENNEIENQNEIGNENQPQQAQNAQAENQLNNARRPLNAAQQNDIRGPNNNDRNYLSNEERESLSRVREQNIQADRQANN